MRNASLHYIGASRERWAGRALAECFDDRAGCAVLRDGRLKRILRFPAQGSDSALIKIYLYADPRARLKAMLGRVGAGHDWRVVERLALRDIATPEPIAAIIERGALGAPRRSMFVSRYAAGGQTLGDHIRRLCAAESDTDTPLRALAARAGSAAARLHQAGVIMADLNAGNLLIDTGGGFLLIDYERVRFVKRLAPARRLGNLRILGASFHALGAAPFQAFCHGYLRTANDIGDASAWMAALERLSAERFRSWEHMADQRFARIGRSLKRKRQARS